MTDDTDDEIFMTPPTSPIVQPFEGNESLDLAEWKLHVLCSAYEKLEAQKKALELEEKRTMALLSKVSQKLKKSKSTNEQQTKVDDRSLLGVKTKSAISKKTSSRPQDTVKNPIAIAPRTPIASQTSDYLPVLVSPVLVRRLPPYDSNHLARRIECSEQADDLYKQLEHHLDSRNEKAQQQQQQRKHSKERRRGNTGSTGPVTIAPRPSATSDSKAATPNSSRPIAPRPTSQPPTRSPTSGPVNIAPRPSATFGSKAASPPPPSPIVLRPTTQPPTRSPTSGPVTIAPRPSATFGSKAATGSPSPPPIAPRPTPQLPTYSPPAVHVFQNQLPTSLQTGYTSDQQLPTYPHLPNSNQHPYIPTGPYQTRRLKPAYYQHMDKPWSSRNQSYSASGHQNHSPTANNQWTPNQRSLTSTHNTYSPSQIPTQPAHATPASQTRPASATIETQPSRTNGDKHHKDHDHHSTTPTSNTANSKKPMSQPPSKNTVPASSSNTLKKQNYQSPLATLGIHPEQSTRTTKKNDRMDKPLCIFEAEGGTCNDDTCRSMHFRDF